MRPFRLAALAMLAVGHTGEVYAQARFDATLLWPIDSQITFHAAQPGYFALIGVARDSSVHLLWHDVADDGFVYVPMPDSGYVRVYFLASAAALDLAGLEHTPNAYTLDQAIASAAMVEGYDRKPERQFFTLADPERRDYWTRYKERSALTDDARNALRPPKLKARVDKGLSGTRYLYCLYARTSVLGAPWWCAGVQ